MKRRASSGGRPGGANKSIARHHARYKYSLCILNDEGELAEPTEAEVKLLRERHPEIARKLEDSAQSSGLVAGSWQETCHNIVDNIIRQKRAQWFKAPVDHVALGIPDYPQVIKEPMDLGTVKKQLIEGKYTEAAQVAAHVRLTFDNAMRYNQPVTVFHQDAKKLKLQFDRKFASAFAPPSAAGPATTTFDTAGAPTEPAPAPPANAAMSAPAAAAAAPTQPPDPSNAATGGGGGGLTDADLQAAMGSAAPAEAPKAVVSDDDDDDSDDDDEEGGGGGGGGGGARPETGGKHPSTGGKGPALAHEDSAFDETADEEEGGFDDDDSQMGASEAPDESEDDAAVSEADIFGDEGEEGDFDFDDDGGGDGTGEGDTSQLDESEADNDDSVFDDEGDDDN